MSKSNLLIIMSDEHQARALSCAGHPLVKTPNIDRLAMRGMRFTNAYTPCPICVPARAAFATGNYVHRTGYWDNCLAYDGGISGWGHILQKHGVRVESIGKLHYRLASDPVGIDVQHQPTHIADGKGMLWMAVRDPLPELGSKPRMLGERIGAGETTYTRYDREITKSTVSWLKNHTEDTENWCLFVGLVAPHFPLTVPQEFLDLYPLEAVAKFFDSKTTASTHPWIAAQREYWDHDKSFVDNEERLTAIAAYFGLCSFLDFNIGQILNALDQLDLAKSTRVLYVSDHGDNLGARGLWGKGNLYEESVTIPLIVSGPGVPIGLCRTAVSLLDVSASIPAYFGIGPSRTNELPGLSLEIIWKAPFDSSRLIFSEYHAYGAPSGAFMVRTGSWKYIHYVGYQPELFDLKNDPEEMHNVVDRPDLRERVLEMQTALLSICDPPTVDRAAKDAQAHLVIANGGREAILRAGASGTTPVPGANS